MAAFTREEAIQHPLDFRLLQNGSVSLYWSGEKLEEDLRTLRADGYRVDRIDLARCCSDSAFHNEVARVLEFPAWYGRNWDAFNDLLEDLEIAGRGRALLFANVEAFNRDSLQALFDVLVMAAWSHLLVGERLVSIFQTSNPSFAIRGGEQAALWTGAERLDRDRGL